MDGIKSDLAAKLLNSPDEKVAAAAKRIFFQSEPTEVKHEEKANSQTCTTSSLLIHKFGTTIPTDIQEAAKAVVMMAPKQYPEKPVETPLRAPATITTNANATTTTTVVVGKEAPIAPAVISSLTSETSLQPSKPQSPSPPPTKLPPLAPGKKIASSDERLQRSRERNKMHARKTRQRKKEHMNQLEHRVQTLKQRQISIKLLIKEKNTANILLGMISNFSDKQAGGGAAASSSVEPRIDALLKRSTDEIPDSTKIPDLPALILPGHHNKRRRLDSTGSVGSNVQQEYPNDGIDYELLGKDRTSCTPEELDKIRKERNRMHAKRTRDRKRIFMEEMEKIIKQLEAENQLLEEHLSAITTDSVTSSAPSSGRVTPTLNSPVQKSLCPTEMLQSHGQSSSETQVQVKEATPQNAPDNVTKDMVVPSSTNILSEAVPSKPQHDDLKEVKKTNIPIQATVVASSEISTVSLSPTPHHSQGASHICSSGGSSTNEMTPLELPSSITTSSGTPIQC